MVPDDASTDSTELRRAHPDRLRKTRLNFDDVRDIQRTLKGRGLVPTAAADESSTGPAGMVLTDPDGNPILIDQHVPKPRK